jgi:L-seryl-tRNA(Ser) seleniumtransferase
MPASRAAHRASRRAGRGPVARSTPPRAGGPISGREALRSLPQMHQVLEREDVRQVGARHGRALVAALVRDRLQELRGMIRSRALDAKALQESLAGLADWAEGEVRSRTTSTMRPVVNATGVVLHTNLGRAVLSEAAARRVVEVARGYTTLEYDLGRGRRGSRSAHLERFLDLIFPGRAFHVVNNNAAAVLLALNTLAEGKEVIVSRGELVEIGGSFRIPDILRKSGAILKEVGTTNKTRLQDYERAIGERTGLLLKVHPSNYRIVGFTAHVPLLEVSGLAKRRGLPVLMDQGSGNLLDMKTYGLQGEPSVHEALAAGADVVCFSGDKMLGGPQAGLIVGKPDLLKKMKENPLSRALRVDKMTYAALETTILEHARGSAATGLPVIRMIAETRETIERRARLLAEEVEKRALGKLVVRVVPGVSLVGAGSAPEEGLPTALLAVTAPERRASALEARLRAWTPPVIARIEEGQVLLDLRTVLEGQDRIVGEALVSMIAEP